MVAKNKGFVVFCGAPCDEQNIQEAISYCKSNNLTPAQAKIIKLDNSVIVKIK